MVDYTQWQQRFVQVVKLQLDPQNPRIPATTNPLSQHELITELVQHDRVLELAKSIIQNGFFPTEVLVATQEGGALYILEGNRRLAALKLLISPESAPEGFASKFRSLSEQIQATSIEKVPVVISPSRDAATPLIVARHTREQIQGWSRTMQARFFQSLLGRGANVDELSARFGIAPAEIVKFKRIDTLYELACSLKLPAEVLAEVQNPRTFPMTALERAIDSKHVRAFLGIDLDRDDVIVGRIAPAEFQKGLAKIVTDITKGEADTRILNDAASIKKYLEAIPKTSRPNLNKRGNFTAADLISISHQQAAPPAPKPTRPKPRRSTSVIPIGWRCHLKSDRIRDVFDELRRLRVSAFPNSSAMLLRTLLELSVSHYIDSAGKTDEMMKPFVAKGKPKDWYPSLRQQLEFLLEKDPDKWFRLKPLEYKAIRRLQTDEGTPMTLDSLDGFVHNKLIEPAEKELRNIWAILEPLFTVTLVEPQAPTPAANP
jgi:hypothetical protein